MHCRRHHQAESLPITLSSNGTLTKSQVTSQLPSQPHQSDSVEAGTTTPFQHSHQSISCTPTQLPPPLQPRQLQRTNGTLRQLGRQAAPSRSVGPPDLVTSRVFRTGVCYHDLVTLQDRLILLWRGSLRDGGRNSDLVGGRHQCWAR